MNHDKFDGTNVYRMLTN